MYEHPDRKRRRSQLTNSQNKAALYYELAIIDIF